MALYETTQMDTKSFQALADYDVPSWVGSLRDPAKEAYLKGGWPTRKDEDWRYTSLRGMKEIDFNWSHTKGLISKPEIEEYLIKGTLPIVMVDGVYDSTQSFKNVLPEGVTIKSLKSAWQDHKSEIKSLLSQASAEHAFTQLNKAFLLNGIYIDIKKGVELEKPIHILFINTKKPKPFSLFPRVIMNMGASAKASVYTSYEHQGEGTYFHSGACDFLVGQNAFLTNYTAQKASPHAFHYEQTNVAIERDGRYSAFNLALGGKLCRQELHVRLLGEGANARLDGVYLAKDKAQIDNYSVIEHVAPHCESHQFYKGILTDEGRGVFSGKVAVHQDAQKTNAFQMNKNLLLSNSAEIDTKPQLLIDADDVKCSHGATVGQLKEDELFYLQSRGIDKKSARSMLSKAFVTEILFAIEDKVYQKEALKALDGWIGESI